MDPTRNIRARQRAARRQPVLSLIAALALLLAAAPAGAAERGGKRPDRSAGKAARPSGSAPVAAKKRKPAPIRRAPASRSVPAAADPGAPPAATVVPIDAERAASAGDGQAAAVKPRPGKPRVYTFGGLDLEGKLKTPQLLYFRSRMRQELDTSSPPRRSFLKELEETADAEGL